MLVSPLQIVAELGAISAVRLEVTVTVLEATVVHPFTSVAVTEYVVVDAGLSVILEFTEPLLHE